MPCSTQDERGATLMAQQSIDYRQNSAVPSTSSRFVGVNDVHMMFDVFAFVSLRMNHSSHFIILQNRSGCNPKSRSVVFCTGWTHFCWSLKIDPWGVVLVTMTADCRRQCCSVYAQLEVTIRFCPLCFYCHVHKSCEKLHIWRLLIQKLRSERWKNINNLKHSKENSMLPTLTFTFYSTATHSNCLLAQASGYWYVV